MRRKIKLMLTAGEASGDAHAAALITNLREVAPEIDFEFFGLTGVRMRESGARSIVDSDDLAIMGLLEIGRALPRFWRVFQTLKRAALAEQPDAVILVDFPDFNLPLAKLLKRRGFAIVYYVSPQLWAWRSHRIRSIRRNVDLLLTILPFEKNWYAERNVHHVEFVGNPLVGEVCARLSKNDFCRRYGLNENAPIVALLPGSRSKEITKILPSMLDAAAILQTESPQTQFVIAQASTRAKCEIEVRIQNSKFKIQNLSIVENDTRSALAAADAAAVASGTATLEAALIGTPLVVCYKVSAHNWHALRHLIRVPHYGLVNLIAEKRLAVELIQNDLTGVKLANELRKLLEPEQNAAFRQELRKTAEKLGAGGASRLAAEKVLEFLNKLRLVT
jgi:lipid-A-disaccharide synthase